MLCTTTQTQRYSIFGMDYKGKDTFSAGLFIETLINDHILPNDKVEEGIIWSDWP